MDVIPSSQTFSEAGDRTPLSPETQQSPESILAVIVLYRKKPSESPALNSVLRAAALSRTQLRFKVLLYDNSPEEHAAEVLPQNVQYRKSPGNYGLAGAYNSALQLARTECFEWLLTLDHDTVIPDSFLERISEITNIISVHREVAAIVPEVFDHDVFISPNIVVSGRRPKRLPERFIGIPDKELAAINSATTWRVSTLIKLGGFNPLFWLDYLDLWAFLKVHRAGHSVYVAGDLQVQHELSLLHRNNSMSPARLENYLAAQSAFFDLYRSASDGVLLTAQLIVKLCGQFLRHESIDFKRLTWRCIRRRLLKTRISRIEDWKKDAKERIAKLA